MKGLKNPKFWDCCTTFFVSRKSCKLLKRCTCDSQSKYQGVIMTISTFSNQSSILVTIPLLRVGEFVTAKLKHECRILANLRLVIKIAGML